MSIFEKIFNDPDFDQLNNLSRWNGLSRLKEETVAHHSFMVAWFTRILVEELFKKDLGLEDLKFEATTYALFHDFDEIFSGDIAHNVKYNKHNGSKIREAVDEFVRFKIEDKFNENDDVDKMFKKYLNKDIDPICKNIVKVSDWLSMFFYLKKEVSLGNRNLMSQYEYCKVKIKEEVMMLKNYLDLRFSESDKQFLRFNILENIMDLKINEI